MASKQVIAQTAPWFAGALQTGPDLKIYMAMWKDTAISVINNPDVYGPGCNFQFNKISFGKNGEPVQFGLPSIIQSDLNISLIPYDFVRTGDCHANNAQFNINRISGVDSVQWDFGDGGNSRAFSPFHQYATAGFYTVTLKIYGVDCSGTNITNIQKNIWLAGGLADLLGTDIATCSFENLQLSVSVTGVNYLWSTGNTTDKITVTQPGKYWVEIEQQGCTLADTVNITVKPKPYVNAGNDTTVCLNEGITLNAGNGNASNYLWSTGEISPSIKVYRPGVYSVTVTQDNCKAIDSVNIGWGNCPFYIPNAFSPNNDGVNDYFGILNGFAVQNFSIKVYNRYGQVIFKSSDITTKWDGRYKGKPLPIGAYPWSIVYINDRGYTKWLQGTVLIVH